MTTTGSGASDTGRVPRSGRDPYAEWDAAYVLGALATEERHDYERHLRTCADCTRRVAEIAGIPGLLGLVPTAEVLETAASPGVLPRSDGLPRLLDAARRRRRRGRILQAGLLLAVAAVAATVAIVLPARLAPASIAEPPGELVTLHQVVPNPLSADVRLAAQPGGTRIDGSCSYGLPESGTESGTGTGAAAERAYAMFVTDRNGEATQVASWLAGPGMTVPVAGTTKLDTDEIASVDIRLQPNGIVLLAAEPGVEQAQ
ncbi:MULTISPECIES: zf-HC2 domain-containing protein [unclassified Cryobacterium]|uniref:anti-sigma factor family protein n=1 Tax=unclassified Cryobacterium TaxID=2649013 RepID=UPI002AB507CF|nr:MULTISPECIES: zf-HC2 domain-containing protein [unclassified Cryobacterium]MDY7528052.1 zf-HC2 domain-containing protein [Cryobacterium sp. 10C2]MDY7556192.1 zf-HC2 domain-containing protein [Cryobacterium sp. 10C3]MEB0002604.1 zf-HC2 domain-containing protein [Cryobacterium sp. RTC2.1]MEB0200435.1 zf-HC2 domain-containing protein [Cryobacterium sp. 5I3]MEB0291267.1 zf-HC2 domain-containing protein [Cryobacterium sp. 10C2]